MFGRFGGGMMGGWGYGYGPYGFGGFSWLGLIGMIVHLLVWVGVFITVFYFLRRWSGNVNIGRKGAHSSALDILAERYARGEITSEQYKQMKQELS